MSISYFKLIYLTLCISLLFCSPAYSEEDDFDIPYERCGNIKAIIPLDKDVYQIMIDQNKYGMNTTIILKVQLPKDMLNAINLKV